MGKRLLSVTGLLAVLLVGQQATANVSSGYFIDDVNAEMSFQWAKNHCVKLRSAGPGLECHVEKFGSVLGDTEGRLFYQLQYYRMDGVTVGQGEVVLRADGGPKAELRPLVAAFDDALGFYERPQLINSPVARWLLIPGWKGATANANIDQLYRYHDGDVEDIDESWSDELRRRLPEGLSVAHGIRPDYHTMTARASLMKDGECYCTPTGGTAFIHLALSGRKLVLKDVLFRRARSKNAGH
jgi:hypothetical protein